MNEDFVNNVAESLRIVPSSGLTLPRLSQSPVLHLRAKLEEGKNRAADALKSGTPGCGGLFRQAGPVTKPGQCSDRNKIPRHY